MLFTFVLNSFQHWMQLDMHAHLIACDIFISTQPWFEYNCVGRNSKSSVQCLKKYPDFKSKSFFSNWQIRTTKSGMSNGNITTGVWQTMTSLKNTHESTHLVNYRITVADLFQSKREVTETVTSHCLERGTCCFSCFRRMVTQLYTFSLSHCGCSLLKAFSTAYWGGGWNKTKNDRERYWMRLWFHSGVMFSHIIYF